MVFGDLFEYEKNRAILFQLDQEIPVNELKKCINATLMYHKVKDDITLGLLMLMANKLYSAYSNWIRTILKLLT